MRRANAIITAGIFILFLIHLVWGVLLLLGLARGGSVVFSFFSYALTAFILLHALIGCRLTLDTLRAEKLAGVSYPGQNRMFWIRRLSGFALLIFMVVHILIFNGQYVEGVFLLNHFDRFALLTQLLMVLTLFVHLLTNIRPLKIAFGLEDKRSFKTDVLIVLAALLLLAAVAFLIYYIRWRRV